MSSSKKRNERLTMVLEMIALYDEHEKGVELLVSVHYRNEIARIAVGHDLRGGEGGREESKHVSSGYRDSSFSILFASCKTSRRESLLTFIT